MHISRIMFASNSSGSGKTTVVCGLLQALKVRYENGKLDSLPVALKCGPDYIDSLFHKNVLNIPCGNIDSYFSADEDLKAVFAHDAKNASFAIIESAMGYYDGSNLINTDNSAYEIAKILDSKVILVIDAKAMGHSIIAVIKGIIDYKVDSHICGIILNNIKASTYESLKPVIEKECLIKVFGYLEHDDEIAFNTRHLGLVTPSDTLAFKEKIEKLGDKIEKTIDVDAILKEASDSSNLEIKDNLFSSSSNNIVLGKEKKIRIAVAYDNAFCFYYRENLDLLELFGAELVYFSPLHDKVLPAECDALYLGGGYPELHIDELASNNYMLSSIRSNCRKGLPVFAECGGFLYLQMSGVLEGTFQNMGKLTRFGYIDLVAERDTLLCKKGEHIKAHEFHYFDTSKNGDACTARKPSGKRFWECVVSSPFDESPAMPPFSQTLNVWAGFPHLYFPSNPDFAKNFVEAGRKYNKMRNTNITRCSACPKHAKNKQLPKFSVKEGNNETK